MKTYCESKNYMKQMNFCRRQFMACTCLVRVSMSGCQIDCWWMVTWLACVLEEIHHCTYLGAVIHLFWWHCCSPTFSVVLDMGFIRRAIFAKILSLPFKMTPWELEPTCALGAVWLSWKATFSSVPQTAAYPRLDLVRSPRIVALGSNNRFRLRTFGPLAWPQMSDIPPVIALLAMSLPRMVWLLWTGAPKID